MPGYDLPPRDRVRKLGIATLVIVLLSTSAYGLASLVRERRHAQDLTAANAALTASLVQMQGQLQAVSDKLNAMAAQAAAAPAPAPEPAPIAERRPPVRRAARLRKTVRAREDPRWKQMQARLADQQKQIDAARQETTEARKELQDNLNSTRDDLQGSIARNHDELVVLQRRGERNYYEFQIDKSKEFHTVGPFRISLRKVNVKQGSYDVAMVVDDRQLQKKHVNLYEPLMFTLADRPQPVELVVNQISKNQVKGYISEPKYKKSELTAAAPAAATPDPKTLQRR
jgi:hypothetical protein